MRSWADDLSEPALNYVALFSRSGQGHNVWVKRVIGKGGDKLEFHDNAVYRNGTKLNRTLHQWRDGVLNARFVYGARRNNFRYGR